MFLGIQKCIKRYFKLLELDFVKIKNEFTLVIFHLASPTIFTFFASFTIRQAGFANPPLLGFVIRNISIIFYVIPDYKSL